MWMLNRHKSLGEFFDAAREIGFETFELNHFVSRDLVNGSRLPEGRVRSVHAPCPTDPRTQNAEVSSLDKDERQLAVEAVLSSIALAEQIGAEAVILHAGHVPVNEELEKELRQLYNRGLQNSARYRDMQAELIAERARSAERHLDATRHSLERLATAADSAGVRIGLENRFFYNEIPLPDELDLIVGLLNGVPGFTCRTPGGAFYVWPNVTEACRRVGAADSEEFRRRLLNEAGVAVLADIHFGSRVPGEGQHIRFSYAASRSAIETGVGRIAGYMRRNERNTHASLRTDL
jgi:hypothetical protein